MERRTNARTDVPARVELRFSSFTNFVSQYVANVSDGGMFIVTSETYPVGTPLEFRLALADGYPLIQGIAQVVWVRAPEQVLEGPPGMAVRFHEVDEAGRQLIGRLVRQRRESGEEAFQLGEGPHRPVPSVPDTGGDPFRVEPPVRVMAPGVSFDVFPAPTGEDETESGGDAFTVTRLEEESERGDGGTGSSSAVLVALVAVLVLGVAGFAYLRARSSENAVSASPGTHLARPAAGTPVQAGGVSQENGRTVSTGVSSSGTPEAVSATGVAASTVSGKSSPAREGASPVATAAAENAASLGAGEPSAKPQSAGGKSAGAASPLPGKRRAARMIRIDVRKVAGGTRVAIALDGPAGPSILRGFSMRNPPRYVVQLGKVVADDPFAVIPAGTPEVAQIRMGYHVERRPPYLQIVLDLTADGVTVQQRTSRDTLLLDVRRGRR